TSDMRKTNPHLKYRRPAALTIMFMIPLLSFARPDLNRTDVQNDRAEQGTGAKTADPTSSLGSGDTPIYWCPMRGLKGCGLKDYSGPGKCEVCKMLLVPKSSFLEEYKNELASTRNDWPLTKVGREEIYYCPNRGRPDHSLKEYTAPG